MTALAGWADVQGGYAKTPYFLAGAYDVVITTVKAIQKRETGEPGIAIEARITASSNPERPVGMVAGTSIVLASNIKFKDMRRKDLKQFATAAMEAIEADVPKDNKEFEEAFSQLVDAEAFVGAKLHLDGVPTERGFVRLTWRANT